MDHAWERITLTNFDNCSFLTDKENDEVILQCAQKLAKYIQEGINLKLTEHNHSALFEKLAKHSSNWREIGIYLGFFWHELDNIEARPSLRNTPKDWLNAMLQMWFQWAPEDSRGSTNHANLKDLIDALNKAELGETALLIMDIFIHS